MLRGELNWMTMRALDKNRNHRYATANDLARDIERYLANEPVEAGPPSSSYRLRKYARRNLRALSIATAFAILLVSATAISVWQAVAHAAASQGPAVGTRGAGRARFLPRQGACRRPAGGRGRRAGA